MESLKDMVNHFSCMIYEYADRAEMQWTMVKSVKDSSRLLDFFCPQYLIEMFPYPNPSTSYNRGPVDMI